MTNDDPLFISKDGEVWACWLNGKPAVNLGSEQNFWAAAEKLFDELHPVKKRDSESSGERDISTGDPLNSSLTIEETIERSEDRHEVTIIGRLYGADGSREVTICDLSTHGCRVQDHSFAKPGAIVTIKIGTIGPIRAVIRWRRDKFIGLKFEDPLYPSVLEHIRQKLSLR